MSRGTPQAMTWLRSVDPLGVHPSALNPGEIRRGIALRQKSDPTAAGHLVEWLRKLRHDHADRILPVTDQIAATTIVHDLILVTRNVKDFEDTDAP